MAVHARRGPEITIESFGISGRERSATTYGGGVPARAAGTRAPRKSSGSFGSTPSNMPLAARALTNVAADKAATVV
jgi:hypothetical protein